MVDLGSAVLVVPRSTGPVGSEHVDCMVTCKLGGKITQHCDDAVASVESAWNDQPNSHRYSGTVTREVRGRNHAKPLATRIADGSSPTWVADKATTIAW